MESPAYRSRGSPTFRRASGGLAARQLRVEPARGDPRSRRLVGLGLAERGAQRVDADLDVHADQPASAAGGITARIARRQIESSTRLGRHRWKVERALSWLSCFRRLQVRWDRDAGRWFAFVLVACAVVCFNRL
jgi:transposase